MIMRLRRANMWLAVFLLTLAACSQENNSKILYERSGYHFPYRLARPGQTWKLPRSLVEISGLGFIDENRLACVQDENGIIFIYNLQAGAVEREVHFGRDGDYEGIEVINDDAWVLKSNGTLYEVKDFLKAASPEVTEYKTPLKGRNDAEGLAYDPLRHSLLIACKGEPFTDKRDGRRHRAVYRFDLETRQMDPEPFLLIDLDTLRSYQDLSAITLWGMEVMAYFNPPEGDRIFAPSGIAIHPKTEDIYILGSVGKLLLVFSGEKELRAIVSLDPGTFPKPEGICFSPDGTLYIASEGKGGEGRIIVNPALSVVDF
ncbi:MAG: hypothetical protein R6W71_04630 [Bacteroidales bacterium]